MKTTSFRFILAALAATVALAGCTKEITPPNFENDKVNPEGSRIIAVSFAPQTKTKLDGFQPKFVDNDSILISNGVAIDTCDVEVEGNVATISTNLTGPLTAVYPYTAAKMNGTNKNQIDTVLVSTEQDGSFASANICMAKNISEDAKTATFENKTAVFKITPGAGAGTKYVEVSAAGRDIANNVPDGSNYKSTDKIHVNTTTADSVYVSILVPDGLKVGDLTFSDGTNEKAITTGAQAGEEIAAGTLYTVTEAEWKSPEADIPGALKGKFSVSAGKQVQFSQGNLTYDVNASTNKWKFYENQYYCAENSSASETLISLFTWGYGDWSKEPTTTTYLTSHTSNDESFESFDSSEDWGTAIDNKGTWRTLTKDEWCYLFAYDPEKSDFITTSPRYPLFKIGVTVCGKANCVVLLPDGWKWEGDVGTEWQTEYPETQTNNEVTWQKMEDAGAVCLPAAGVRDGSIVNLLGDVGCYWSSSAYSESSACYVVINGSNVAPFCGNTRSSGFSVRLVTDVSAAPTPTEPTSEYVEIEAKYDGTNVTKLKWYRQNLAITESGNKKWKGGNESAVKVPGTDDDVIVGDYFQWGTYKGYCGESTAADKGLLIYDSFINTKCDGVTGTNDFDFKSTGDGKTYQFATESDETVVGISPHYDSSKGKYTKYTDEDDKTILDTLSSANDDVASIILGDNWRMPTSAEFKAMREATYWAWDGTDKGYYVFAPDENHSGGTQASSIPAELNKADALLFFPAAGYGYETSLYGVGSNGRYWSSTLYSDETDYAYYLYFESDSVSPQENSYRCRGGSVRPVSE